MSHMKTEWEHEQELIRLHARITELELEVERLGLGEQGFRPLEKLPDGSYNLIPTAKMDYTHPVLWLRR